MLCGSVFLLLLRLCLFRLGVGVDMLGQLFRIVGAEMEEDQGGQNLAHPGEYSYFAFSGIKGQWF